MQTIQHATNLPYIPQYTMWNYAIEHPILFFLMTCFMALIVGAVFENVLKVIFANITKSTTVVNNNKGE